MNITVAICVDDKYAVHTNFIIRSIGNSIDKNTKCKLYVIYRNLSIISINFIESIASEFPNIELIFKKLDFNIELPVSTHFTQAIYNRLFIPELIDEPRVLYLDTDIIVDGNIEQLFNIDLGNNFIAAVPDYTMNSDHGCIAYCRDFLKMPIGSTYINSGVLLFNNPVCKQESLREKCIDTVHKLGNPAYGDQDSLNLVCLDRKVILPYKFNIEINCMVYLNPDLKEKPVVYHYIGGYKLWDCPNHPEYDKWRKYS